MGYVPQGKRWRMPTSKEFDAAGDYLKVGAYSGITGNAAGTTAISFGWRRQNLNQPYFPTSGVRDVSTGSLNWVGRYGYYWSSSPHGANNGFYLFLTDGTLVSTGNAYDRTISYPARCVAE